MEAQPAGIRRQPRRSVDRLDGTPTSNVENVDSTYRDILGKAAWARLEPEVRGRFSRKPGPGQKILYTGVMRDVELSFAGWLFAQACRLIGTPLAPYRGRDVAMLIELAPDAKRDGVAWNRIYDFPPDRRFTVCSTKSRGPGGELIEHIGRGFSMRLVLSEVCGNLVFTSVAYEWSFLGLRIRIPPLLTPGVTTVAHEQLEGDRFRFWLSVDHPLFGCTIFQDGEFSELR